MASRPSRLTSVSYASTASIRRRNAISSNATEFCFSPKAARKAFRTGTQRRSTRLPMYWSTGAAGCASGLTCSRAHLATKTPSCSSGAELFVLEARADTGLGLVEGLQRGVQQVGARCRQRKRLPRRDGDEERRLNRGDLSPSVLLRKDEHLAGLRVARRVDQRETRPAHARLTPQGDVRE